MNKKLFAMIMVPVLVVMGGTFAFSAWTGQANAFFDQSAANVGYTETLTFEHTNAHFTNLTITGTEPSAQNLTMNDASLPMLVSQSSGSSSGIAVVIVNVSNMVPGDYVNFTVQISNTGTAALNASMFKTGEGSTLSGAEQNLSAQNILYPHSYLQPPFTSTQINNWAANGVPGLNFTMTGLWSAFEGSTLTSTPNILGSGQTLTYSVYLFLSGTAGPSAMNTEQCVAIGFPLTAMQ